MLPRCASVVWLSGGRSWRRLHDAATVQHLDQWITAGADWIAVVLVMFSAWRSGRTLAAAYTLGAISSLGFTLQLLGWGVPGELLSMLPFIATLVVLILASALASKGSPHGPASLAVPYSRERR
jgi:ABC-type uncharacterized transport system permease subunit